MATPVPECVDALYEATRRLDESPSKANYEDLGLRPASATIIRTMGGWNEAKRRAGLETNTSTGSRTLPKPDDVDLPDGTEWEELTVDQRWHYRHSELNNSKTADRRERLATWVAERKVASGGCLRCGEDDPRCLDYHHREDAEKSMNVSTMVNDCLSREQIRQEIRKCEVLCANCHRKEHLDSFGIR
jgi:hypothetical protein